jgi:hypothetical protein
MVGRAFTFLVLMPGFRFVLLVSDTAPGCLPFVADAQPVTVTITATMVVTVAVGPSDRAAVQQ